MDFVPSPEHALLRRDVHRYLTEHYNFPRRCAMLRDAPGLSPTRWKALAQLDWLGTEVPQAFGGSEGTPTDTGVILEEFGRFLVPEPLLACAVLPTHLLRATTASALRTELLTTLVRGERVVVVAQHAPDPRGASSREEMCVTVLPGGRFLLTGERPAVIAADRADHLIIAARTSEHRDDTHGHSLFVIDPAWPGVMRRAFRTIDGGSAADITLREVEIGPSALLGTDGHATCALRRASTHFIVGACAEAVGIMDALVKTTAEYLKTRRAYGNTLSTFQALQHRLADMLIELELSRSMLMRVLDALASADEDARRKEVAAARVLIGRASRFIASSAIQLHGAIGVVEEHIIGHYLKRLNVMFALCGPVTSSLRQYAGTDTGALF